jgi:hypothetical protein
MTTSDEQAQLRAHLAELRRATSGLGRDFKIELGSVEKKIERLPTLTAKEAKYALLDIEDDFSALGRSIQQEARRLPGEIRAGVVAAGERVGEGASRFADATRDTLEDAGHRAKEGAKTAFAAAAGVRRTPMKEWHAPPETEESKSP